MAQADTKKPVKLPRTAKGKKPIYFDSVTDKLLSMVLTLMGELSVTRDRLDTLERLIEKHKLFKQDDIEGYELSDEVNAIRTERRAAYIARVLKSVQDELESLQAQGEGMNTEVKP
jgi:hypothetical protein